VLRLHCSGAQVEGAVDEQGSVNWDGRLSLDAGPATLRLEWLSTSEQPAELILVELN
jgi:hypothetical protein